MFNDYFFSCSIWKIKKKFSFHCASLSHFFIPPPTAFYYIFNIASYKMAPLICFPCWSLQQVLSLEMPCSEKDKVPETEAKADCLLGQRAEMWGPLPLRQAHSEQGWWESLSWLQVYVAICQSLICVPQNKAVHQLPQLCLPSISSTYTASSVSLSIRTFTGCPIFSGIVS